MSTSSITKTTSSTGTPFNLPNIDCVEQTTQQSSVREVNVNNRTTYTLSNIKMIGMGRPSSFNLQFSADGLVTQLAQRFKSPICDIHISGSFSGIICAHVDYNSIYKATLDSLIKSYGGKVLSFQESSGMGTNYISTKIKRNLIEGGISKRIRIYGAGLRSGILKVSIAANNRNYSLFLQSINNISLGSLESEEGNLYNKFKSNLSESQKNVINKYMEY